MCCAQKHEHSFTHARYAAHRHSTPIFIEDSDDDAPVASGSGLASGSIPVPSPLPSAPVHIAAAKKYTTETGFASPPKMRPDLFKFLE